MSLDTSASSLRRLAEQRLESLRSQASTFTTPLQKTSHMEMRTFLRNFYETIWTAQKRKFYDDELQQYPRLGEIYQELVVVQKKLTYEDFWQRYEYRCDMSRVIHWILQREDPDLVQPVMEPLQTIRNATVSQSHSREILHGACKTTTSWDPTAPTTNINYRSQFIERPMLSTTASIMNTNDNADTVVVNVVHPPRLVHPINEVIGTPKNESVPDTELVSSNPPMEETSLSASMGGESGEVKDKNEDSTDRGMPSATEPLAGKMVDKVKCSESTCCEQISQEPLDDTIVTTADIMVNGSLVNEPVDTRHASTNGTLVLADSTAGVVEASHDSDSISESDVPLLLSEDEEEVVNESLIQGADVSASTTIDNVKKSSNVVSLVFLMKCALGLSILVASILGLAVVLVVREGVVPIDTLCAPVRPGLDVTFLETGNSQSSRFSAPWWAPEDLKETCFSMLCAKGGFLRTEIQIDWNAKKRFMGIAIVDVDKDKTLLTMKQVRSFQLLPDTLQLRAESTRGRVTTHAAPWSTNRRR